MITALTKKCNEITVDDSSFEAYWKSKNQKAWFINCIELILTWGETEVKRKIKAYQERTCNLLTKEELSKIDEIMKKKGKDLSILESIIYKLILGLFAKKPNRQSTDEKIQFDFLEKTFPLSQKLPFSIAYGHNPVYLNKKGWLVSKTEEHKGSKSIDFHSFYKNANIYTTAKFTSAEGSSQGQQYYEIKQFAKCAVNNKQDNVYFVILADGDFYQRNQRIEILRKLCKKNPRCFVITSNEWNTVKEAIDKKAQ